MKITYVIGITVAVLAVSSPNARAGDWLDQSYVSFDIGPAFLPHIHLYSDSSIIRAVGTDNYGKGIRGDLILGYNVSSLWAIELEAGAIWNPTSWPDGSGNMYQIPFLMNAVYQIPLNDAWKPYLQAGVGGVATTLDAFLATGGSTATAERRRLDDVAFACQAAAGIKYQFSTRAEVGLEYKFLGSFWHSWDLHTFAGDAVTLKSDAIYTHAVLLSLTWKL